MCKESSHFQVKKVPIHPHPSPQGEKYFKYPLCGSGCISPAEVRSLTSDPSREREGLQREKREEAAEEHHHHHDDEEHAAHGSVRPRLGEQQHEHEKHDDMVSLAHRHHDHKHPIHLLAGGAGFRQSACHAGDGHDHGDSPQSSFKGSFTAAPIGGISLGGGGQHHEEGEHEHCPHCDEHLVDDKCGKCGYEHSH